MMVDDQLTHDDLDDAVIELAADISGVTGYPVTGAQVWQYVHSEATGRTVAELSAPIAALALDVRERQAQTRAHADAAVASVPPPAPAPGSGFVRLSEMSEEDARILDYAMNRPARSPAPGAPSAAGEVERLAEMANELALSARRPVRVHAGSGDRPGRRGPAYADSIAPTWDADGGPAGGSADDIARRHPGMLGSRERHPGRAADRAGRPRRPHERIREDSEAPATDARQPARGGDMHPAVAAVVRRHPRMFGAEAPRGSSGPVGGRR